jgi:hypothetical protein
LLLWDKAAISICFARGVFALKASGRVLTLDPAVRICAVLSEKEAMRDVDTKIKKIGLPSQPRALDCIFLKDRVHTLPRPNFLQINVMRPNSIFFWCGGTVTFVCYFRSKLCTFFTWCGSAKTNFLDNSRLQQWQKIIEYFIFFFSGATCWVSLPQLLSAEVLYIFYHVPKLTFLTTPGYIAMIFFL